MLVTTIGGGDGLQAIKKGIMEVADIIVVNKTDGLMEDRAKRYRAEIDSTLRLLRKRYPDWQVPCLAVSSETNYNIPKLWDLINNFKESQADQIKKKRR